MQTDTTRILGDWATLSDQLDRAGTISGWVAAEPVFTELRSVAQLHGWWQRGESDAMIGALVRLAAADGGDDLDAATVLLHLLEPGARNLARRLARHRDDALGVVLGELACQIRIYPWRRRSRRVRGRTTARYPTRAVARRTAPQPRGAVRPALTASGHRATHRG